MNYSFTMGLQQRWNDWLLILIASCVVAFPGSSDAQTRQWPELGKPIKLSVGYSPGGGTDTIARLLAKKLGEILDRPVVVENRSGAGGRVNALSVVNAKPDGYTLLFAADPELSIAPAVLKSMTYDPLKDFQPITQIATLPYIVAASSSFPPNTISELITYSKKNPGKVHYGSSGVGTSIHLLSEELNARANIDTVHVPYKGITDELSDLIAGNIQYTFGPPLAMRSLIEAGKLKALTVAATQRLRDMPDVPTTAEVGFPGLVGGSWYALLAPKGTPQYIVDRLQTAAEKAIRSQEINDAFANLAISPRISTPEELTLLMTSETKKWRQLMSQIGLDPV